MKRKTHKEFLDEMKIIHPELKVLGEYKNSQTKILIEGDFGIHYMSKPNNLLQGMKPSILTAINMTEAFNVLLKKSHPHLKILGEYKKREEKILVEDDLGIKYLILADNLLNGQTPSINSAIDRQIAFQKKAKNIHGNKYDYSNSNYINARTKVEILCNDCKSVFFQTPGDHLFGQGCNNCNKIRLKQDGLNKIFNKSKLIVDEINEKFNGRINCDKMIYRGNKIKTLFGCNINKKHGYWEVRPNDILSGYGCPICKSSKGEIKIKEILDSNSLEYNMQKTFKNCKHKRLLKFDFYLPDFNICIEYDGLQHFEPVVYFGGEEKFKEIQKKDSTKNEFCKKEGISLLRISYTQFNEMEKFIFDFIKQKMAG